MNVFCEEVVNWKGFSRDQAFTIKLSLQKSTQRSTNTAQKLSIRLREPHNFRLNLSKAEANFLYSYENQTVKRNLTENVI